MRRFHVQALPAGVVKGFRLTLCPPSGTLRIRDPLLVLRLSHLLCAPAARQKTGTLHAEWTYATTGQVMCVLNRFATV